MRNWAKWLVNHNLRWVLYLLVILIQFPMILAIKIVESIPESINEIKHDFRAIAREPRDK